MMRPLLIAAALLAAPASAEVVQSSSQGFEVSHTVTVAAPLERAWAVTLAPRLWWNKEHTYSGDSANLTIDERPGGCFCEKLPGKGGVEHMRIAYIQPPRMVRMIGGLGPLQAEGATGALAITLTKEGEGTKIVLSYVIGGYIRQGPEKLAPLVDRVLGEQMAGLKAAVEGAGAATPASAKPASAKSAPAKSAAPKPTAPRIDAEPLADVGATISGLPAESPSAEPAPADATPAEPKPATPPKDPSIEPESPR